ncbi:MAG: hypothetical protein OCD01_05675 [Fibrobacterales bacterium]
MNLSFLPILLITALLSLMGCNPFSESSSASTIGSTDPLSSNEDQPTSLVDSPESISDILYNVTTVYKEARSYKDTGREYTYYFDIGETESNQSNESKFSTSFKNNGQFRFVHETGEWSYFIIHRDQDSTMQHWWNLSDSLLQDFESLSTMLAVMVGVTSGTSYNISSMLLPSNSPFARNFFDMYPPQIQLDDSDIRGDECYALKHTEPEDGDITILYFRKRDYLLLRIEQESFFSDFRTESFVDYYPTINETLSEDDFEYTIPDEYL